MATTTQQTSALQDQILDFVRQGQDATVKAVQAWSDNVAKLTDQLPATTFPALPHSDDLPRPAEVVDLGFGFAERLLTTQRDFAKNVLTAAQPAFEEAAKAAKNGRAAK